MPQQSPYSTLETPKLFQFGTFSRKLAFCAFELFAEVTTFRFSKDPFCDRIYEGPGRNTVT